jgi:hypothetical protein
MDAATAIILVQIIISHHEDVSAPPQRNGTFVPVLWGAALGLLSSIGKY